MSVQLQHRPITNYKTVSFDGIKPEIRIGEEVLQEFRRKFGYLKSSSFIIGKVNSHEGNSMYPCCLLESLKTKSDIIRSEIYDKDLMQNLLQKTHKSIKDFIVALEQSLKRKGKANCWEDSVIINQALLDKGLESKNFQMVAYLDNGHNINHFSTVFNLKKGAKINDPKTWGSKAIVVDAWEGIVMQASDAINFLQSILAGKQKVTELKFSNANIQNYIKIV
ncbi:MAG: hypothetical protein WC197_01965 [Candidatus Gastranaerophilaceae bacterium]|jgi:hypothetical protein